MFCVSGILGNKIFRHKGEISGKFEYPLNGVPITVVCLHGKFFFLITAGVYFGYFPMYVFIYLGVASFPLLQASLTCSKSLTLCSRELTLMAASLILDCIPSGQNLIDWISRGRAGSLSLSLLYQAMIVSAADLEAKCLLLNDSKGRGGSESEGTGSALKHKLICFFI